MIEKIYILLLLDHLNVIVVLLKSAFSGTSFRGNIRLVRRRMRCLYFLKQVGTCVMAV